jgi:dinuclear metal center YbgI/SA1388 family protein
MEPLRSILDFMMDLAPLSLAEDWDNVGLLVGNPDSVVRRVMTCLTATPSSVAEAAKESADLIIAHHPFPFRPLPRVTLDTVNGRMLARLLKGDIAVFSAHTAFDSASRGINQRLAEGLNLVQIQPLVPSLQVPGGVGTGRLGMTADSPNLDDFAQRVKGSLGTTRIEVVGDPHQTIQKVAVGCGSAGELLDAAVQAGCDAFVLGEARLHTCLEAEARGVSLVLAGHFASEHFELVALAEMLAAKFPTLDVWACRSEADPIRTL